MNATPQQTLDIEDVIVSEENPARHFIDGTIDNQCCARLQNKYLVLYGWMALHEKYIPDLDALGREKRFSAEAAEEDMRAVRELLILSLKFFLDLIYDPEPKLLYWVERLDMRLGDKFIPFEDNKLDGKERFVLLHGTGIGLGSRCLGIICAE